MITTNAAKTPPEAPAIEQVVPRPSSVLAEDVFRILIGGYDVSRLAFLLADL
jgi:hypothetical protein